MSPTSTPRDRRIGRQLIVSAAALALCLLPTACEFGGVPASSDGGGGYGAPAADESAGESEVVVPVGNQRPDDGQGGRFGGRFGGNFGNFGGTRGDGNQGDGNQGDGNQGDGNQGDNQGDGNQGNNGLDVLGSSCADSDLPLHTGFQSSNAECIQTSMGEIAQESQLPSLLITSAPETVGVGEDFQLQVSTRNLVRDRFLGAAAGGYYLESSFLNEAGLQRGHFHTACRMLDSTDVAPNSAPAPEFFLATQDNGGGAAPDTVTIDVPGLEEAGTLQCTSWAGDGSHRTPMMSRANQTPAIDSVRIEVVAGGGGGGNDQ